MKYTFLDKYKKNPFLEMGASIYLYTSYIHIVVIYKEILK